MARDEAPPFARGETFYNGSVPSSLSDVARNYEGKEYVFEDTIYGTGLPVRVRVVRNSAAYNLKPKKLVSFDSANFGKCVNAYTKTTAAHGYPVDELLPAGGVAPNDLFYIVVDGPALVTSPAAGVAVNVGDAIVAITAATTDAPDAGRVTTQDLTGATAVLGTQIVNKVGRAMSALTSGQTATDFLVGVRW